MITVLQIFFVLALIVLIILFVFKRRPAELFAMPANYRELLDDYIPFYANLGEDEKDHFAERLQRFLAAIKITGVNADIEDLDRVLIGAAAIIPVFYIPDWEYVNLREILVYPGNFNMDYEQHGQERTISGMVGTGPMQNVMILTKWDLRQGFINRGSNRNTAIHEFVHLVDKMDGTLDGVPEILLERKYVARWKQLLDDEMEKIRRGESDIDLYGATSPVECFAVAAEYFFEQPEAFAHHHPALDELMKRIFIRKKADA
jgi:Mlc titration factor MtfA (ptsG expression regulator)